MFIYVFFLMIRRPPRSTLDRSSAASDVYKRQLQTLFFRDIDELFNEFSENRKVISQRVGARYGISCLLYTSPSPRDRTRSRMPSSA